MMRGDLLDCPHLRHLFVDAQVNGGIVKDMTHEHDASAWGNALSRYWFPMAMANLGGFAFHSTPWQGVDLKKGGREWWSGLPTVMKPTAVTSAMAAEFVRACRVCNRTRPAYPHECGAGWPAFLDEVGRYTREVRVVLRVHPSASCVHTPRRCAGHPTPRRQF